jgi:hypothetical protein
LPLKEETMNEVHVCDKVHGKLSETPDLDEAGKPIVLGKVAQVTRAYTDLVCHDCGRVLQRPPGVDSTTWMCPGVADTALRATAPGSAVECGGE